VARWEYRTCVVKLNADAIALTYRQQGRLFVALAMSEVEHTVADTQRFAGRMHVAQPHDQIRERPVGRNIECYDRSAKNLDRFSKWRRLENQGARVIFLLVACLIAPTTERNPIARALTNRLR